MLRLSWVFRLALVVGAGALLLTATVAAVAPRMWRIANAHEEVPVELPEFTDLAQRTYVYDASGREIAAFEIENSQPVQLDDVPQHVIDAFLAVEDKEFWHHHGVNMRSLFRATLSNFATEGPTQGASTITMQVVKNDFMAGFDRDGRYKVLQAVYAVRLEKDRSKDEILERYLNTVFFGQNSYGVGAAAETYFGKAVDELTFIEAAFLAGLVQAPSSYDPIINPEQSRTRFMRVLDRLEADELLTDDERAEVEDTFVLPERVRRRAERATERTYFTEALRDYLLHRTTILGETYEERYTQLHRGGLRIHTTLDPVLQARAEHARTVLPDNEAGIEAAIISLDVETGAIRAMVGGSGFVPGQNEVNLALAPSQTGSSIKLFILAAALQAGAHPQDMLDGTHPCRLPNPGDAVDPIFEIRGGVNGGVDNLQRHTARSINCAFARLSQIVGLNRVVDMTYRMAESPYLYHDQPASEREPIAPWASYATGANEMSTLDMASGVQTIANEGLHKQPYYVEYVDDAFGNRVYTHDDPGTQVLDREVALLTIDVLKTVLTSGTASRELSDFAAGRPTFGKTGTQMANWTAFFVGATNDLSTAVLMRDPDRYTEMRNIPEFNEVGVSRVQGGNLPARIWRAYMEDVGLEQFDLPDWDPPEYPDRPAGRLYLPGNECVFAIVGYQPAPEPDPTAPEGEGVAEGFRRPVAPPDEPPDDPPDDGPPPASPPAEPEPEPEPEPPPPPTPIYGRVDTGTTIPPDVLDPKAPLPLATSGQIVRGC